MGKMNAEQLQLFDKIRSALENSNGYAKSAEILKQDFQTRSNSQKLREIYAFYRDITESVLYIYRKYCSYIENILFAVL